MKLIARNRRASFDYDIEHKIVAGIVLSGSETKSLRTGLVSLKGSFAHMKDGEMWLVNAHISAYPHSAPQTSYEPTQPRKLLLSRRQLEDLTAAKKDGRAIVPMAVLGGRYIKVELGIGKGKKRYDKRQAIKERDVARSTERDLSKYSR